ncbi:hypothetical protein WJX82_007029 [Trebouxia sp. C0006]
MQSPTSKSAVGSRRSARQAMASIQSRLHDLSVRCDRFQSKYGVHSAENPDSAEAVYVTLRRPVLCDKQQTVPNCQETQHTLPASQHGPPDRPIVPKV